MSQAPTIAAVVQHRVADFAKWKTVFDGDAGRRKSAGIIRHHINRAAEDENLLSVYLAANDPQQLDGFLNDPELKAAMQKGGVEGKPTINVVKPQEDKTLKDSALFGAMVTHKVADYGKWKKVFDDDGARRSEAGIVGHAVNRSASDENVVVIYLQAKTEAELQSFVTDDALKEVMKEAGVVSAPKIALVHSGEWGEA